MAPTGKPLLDIELSGEGEEAVVPDTPAASSPAASSAAASAAAAPASDATPVTGVRALATPAVRRIARESNVDITTLNGTGKDGRVTKEDILAFVSGKTSASKPASAAAPCPLKSASAAKPAAAAPAVSTVAGIPADERVPVKGLGRAMVKSMTAAWVRDMAAQNRQLPAHVPYYLVSHSIPRVPACVCVCVCVNECRRCPTLGTVTRSTWTKPWRRAPH